jgi:tetratricopeptide (TPR) repeat protein
MLEMGQYAEALKNFELALTIARDLGYRLRETAILNNIGEHYRRQMRYQEATEYFEQALAIANETADRTMETSILLNIGLLYQGRGNHEQALVQLMRAHTQARELGARPCELEATVSIGDSLRALKRIDEAMLSYQQALDISRQAGSPVFEWRTLYGLARCERLQGNERAALKLLRKSVEVIEIMSSELGTYANRVSFLKNKQIVYNDLAELSQELGDGAGKVN